MSESCLFCKMIAGTIPVTLVHDDDDLIAIDDINPQAPTHVLIIPKRHISTLNDLAGGDDPLVGAMIRRAALIAGQRGLAETGYRTVFNTNSQAGQTVFHIHLHLIGGRRMTWPPG